MKQKYQIISCQVLLSFLIFAQTIFAYSPDEFLLVDGKKVYEELNDDPKNPFALSVGISMSQTEHNLDNTVNQKFVRKELQKHIKKLSTQKALDWLKNQDRYWFVLQSLPTYTCKNGDFIDPVEIGKDKTSQETHRLFENLAQNKSASQLTLTKCPYCCAEIILDEKIHPDSHLSDSHKSALVSQLQNLGVYDQKGVHGDTKLPNYRLSLEAADVLKYDTHGKQTDDIDPNKVKKQAEFIQKLGNPMLFMHHYSNPAAKPDLFKNHEDIDWFANYCKEIVKASPNITHVSPMSQPFGFANKCHRDSLPPFNYGIKQNKFFKNVIDAQVAASKAMKEANPNVKVLLSHQWKLMKPKHPAWHPLNYFDKLITTIADYLYNQEFKRLVTPHLDHFDGIALSLYPPMLFNGTTPEDKNTSGIIDGNSALETIQEVHKAFPGKDIYIVETGCNTDDSQAKKDFIDMTLYVCKIAREQGIPVKGVYFWGQTNDPKFYSEWNKPAGATHFGPFDKLDTANPTASINDAGKHIQEILKSE